MSVSHYKTVVFPAGVATLVASPQISKSDVIYRQVITTNHRHLDLSSLG
jgi:hypothetical protein